MWADMQAFVSPLNRHFTFCPCFFPHHPDLVIPPTLPTAFLMPSPSTSLFQVVLGQIV